MRVAAVKLVTCKSVRVLPPCSSVVSVEVDSVEGDKLLEPPEERSEESLVHPVKGVPQLLVSNPSHAALSLNKLGYLGARV